MPTICGIDRLSLLERLRPLLLLIVASSSISITTVRISPRMAARRSLINEDWVPAHSEAAASGRPESSGRFRGGLVIARNSSVSRGEVSSGGWPILAAREQPAAARARHSR